MFAVTHAHCLTPVWHVQHPLSAVQAFAVALSAFDSKLACR